MTTTDRHPAPSDPARRPVGRLTRCPDRQQSRRPDKSRRLDLPRDRRAVRDGRQRGRRRIRADPPAARLRARRDPAHDQRRDQGAPRGARPADRPRSRQADPRRPGRGRPGDAHLPARCRGGRAAGRRGDPARPDGLLAGPARDHPALPDRPGGRDQPVQLPAQPGRPQALAGDRRGLLDRAQAAEQGPAHDADRRRDHRRGRPARGRRQHPADEPRAGRPDGRRRALQAADVHRQPVGRLADEGAGRQEEGRPRARRQRRRDRRQVRRPRLGRPALPRRSLRLCRPGLHQRPADVHPRGHLGRRSWSASWRGPQALKLGDPLDPETDLGPMVDEHAADRTQRWVDEAVALGGKVLLRRPAPTARSSRRRS